LLHVNLSLFILLFLETDYLLINVLIIVVPGD